MNIKSIDRDSEFFVEAYAFLSEYNWIYRSSNTEYLNNGIFKEIPADWVQFCKQLPNDLLNAIPDGLETSHNIPKSLQNFYGRLKHLQQQLIYKPYQYAADPASHQYQAAHNLKGINKKKSHEIHRLATEIDDILRADPHANRTNIIVIDLGCGLGYVSQLLNSMFGYRVLGIEADAQRVRAAQRRQAQHYPSSTNDVHYVQHFIQQDHISADFLHEQCERAFGPNATTDGSDWRYALVGLHACAALSVTAVNLFVRMQRAHVLAVMPCCYHKMFDIENAPMQSDSRICVRRDCIPLSDAMLRSVSREQWCTDVISIPFLRLACQQCASRWRRMTAQEHDEHGAAMWDRCVLQSVVSDGEMLVPSRNHQIAAPNELSNEWPISKRFALRCKLSGDLIAWSDGHYQKAENVRHEYPEGAHMSELLTGLQATVQFLCEYVVLYDRVCFLKEQLQGAHRTVELRKIFCDLLSPRSFLLMAQK